MESRLWIAAKVIINIFFLLFHKNTLIRFILDSWLCFHKISLHRKDIVPEIWNEYFQKWNCATSFPIPTFMYLLAIYIFPWSVRLFCMETEIGKRQRSFISENT